MATGPLPPDLPPRDPLVRIDAPRLAIVLPGFLDALHDAIVVLDRNRRVVAANQRYAQEFGLRAESVLGGRCSDVLGCPEVDAGANADRCAACTAFEGVGGRRVLRTRPDARGAQRRWEANFSPIVDESGQVTHVVEVWRDITDRSQLEAQLSHSERLASVGALAAGVAHEINNPLASVLAGVESLGRNLARHDSDPEALRESAEILSVLERGVERIRDTTQKLMLMAQSPSAAPDWVDVNRAVLDTLSLLAFQTRKQRIEVVTELAEGLPRPWTSESGVRGVCMNLMANAVQAMPDSGTLHVSTRARGQRIVLAIEDSGPGIAPEHLSRIWEPFFTTKPPGTGTGLGLFVTNHFVIREGGTIRVENRESGGARFIVEFPVPSSEGRTP